MTRNRKPIDVAAWLASLGLPQYAQAFADNDVDGELLPRLSAEDLKDLGVASLGHRKRILAAIEALGDHRSSPPAPANDAAPEGERRQVAILFADLCGFTALSQTMDAEDLHALVSRYAALVDSIVLAFGGSVDKHIGDAVMALFGAPVAHGDDALRAARAAIEIHAGIAKLGRESGRDLAVHIGIACGEVVAASLAGGSRREYTVHGDSVNLAARLVAAAKPGQTIVSEAVYRSLARDATFDPLDAASLKGFDKPVALWSLRSLSRDAASTRTPFVGRRIELEQFAAMISSCETSASGQVLFIRGEPGIGKSRLVGEMMRLARARGFEAQRALIFDFGTGKGQDAIRALVRRLFGLSMSAAEDERRAARERVLEHRLVSGENAVFLDDLLDLGPTSDERGLYDAMDNARRNLGMRQTLASLIENIARERPLVVAIEDIHWADAATLDLLAAIAQAVGGVRALLLLTSRAQGDPIGSAWRNSIAGTSLTTMDIGPLRSDEASSLASMFVSASNRVALACIERAGGNPLFLEQLLRHAENGATEAVPASIQSLVLARMDLLPPSDRIALQAASVLGQRFDLPTLRHLLVSPQYECEVLVAHALVLPEGGTFLFAHALVQEGVYSSMLKSRRRELHRRAAEYFRDSDPVLHAQHLDRAEDPAAARAYCAAARTQRERFHNDRALELVERGLLIANAARDRFELLAARGKLLNDSGEIAESITTFRNALSFASSDAERSRANIGLASGLRIGDELDGALEVLDAAQAAAGESPAALARIHHLRGNIYFPMGRIDACREEHEAGLRYARESGSAQAEARSLGGLGDAAYAQGRMRSAFEHFGRCVELARSHGFGRIEVANRPMVGFSRFFLNQFDEALTDGRETAEAAARVGQPRAEMLAKGICLFVCCELADWNAALTYIADGIGIARRLGAKRFEAQFLEMEGRILLALGRHDDALRRLTEAVAMARGAGTQFTGPSALASLALATDDAAAQRRLLDEGESLLHRGAVAHNHLGFYRDAIEAMIGRHEWKSTLRYASALEDYTRAEPLPWSDLFIARARAIATAAMGEGDGAEAKAALTAVRQSLKRAGLDIYLPAVDRQLASA